MNVKRGKENEYDVSERKEHASIFLKAVIQCQVRGRQEFGNFIRKEHPFFFGKELYDFREV